MGRKGETELAWQASGNARDDRKHDTGSDAREHEGATAFKMGHCAGGGGLRTASNASSHSRSGSRSPSCASSMILLAAVSAIGSVRKQDKKVEGPTRRQRALYTCRGGLTDAFLKETLKLNPCHLHAEIQRRAPTDQQADARPARDGADRCGRNRGIRGRGGRSSRRRFHIIDEVRETIVASIASERRERRRNRRPRHGLANPGLQRQQRP
jgi:hypothetical protein